MTEARDVHSEKAFCPIEERELGRVTVVREEQKSNAFSPMDSRELGRVTVVREVKELNTKSSSVVILQSEEKVMVWVLAWR